MEHTSCTGRCWAAAKVNSRLATRALGDLQAHQENLSSHSIRVTSWHRDINHRTKCSGWEVSCSQYIVARCTLTLPRTLWPWALRPTHSRPRQSGWPHIHCPNRKLLMGTEDKPERTPIQVHFRQKQTKSQFSPCWTWKFFLKQLLENYSRHKSTWAA